MSSANTYSAGTGTDAVGGDAGPGSGGEGAGSALEAMLRKRQMRADPQTDLCEFNASQQQDNRSAGE